MSIVLEDGWISSTGPRYLQQPPASYSLVPSRPPQDAISPSGVALVTARVLARSGLSILAGGHFAHLGPPPFPLGPPPGLPLIHHPTLFLQFIPLLNCRPLALQPSTSPTPLRDDSTQQRVFKLSLTFFWKHRRRNSSIPIKVRPSHPISIPSTTGEFHNRQPGEDGATTGRSCSSEVGNLDIGPSAGSTSCCSWSPLSLTRSRVDCLLFVCGQKD
jgi:hypothetical protein